METIIIENMIHDTEYISISQNYKVPLMPLFNEKVKITNQFFN